MREQARTGGFFPAQRGKMHRMVALESDRAASATLFRFAAEYSRPVQPGLLFWSLNMQLSGPAQDVRQLGTILGFKRHRRAYFSDKAEGLISHA